MFRRKRSTWRTHLGFGTYGMYRRTNSHACSKDCFDRRVSTNIHGVGIGTEIEKSFYLHSANKVLLDPPLFFSDLSNFREKEILVALRISGGSLSRGIRAIGGDITFSGIKKREVGSSHRKK